MTYRVTSITLADALDNVNRAVLSIKNVASAFKTRVQTGSVTYYEVDKVVSDLRANREYMELYRATSGLAQYAKDQANDQAYDIVAEYLAMRTALDDVLNTARTALNAASNLVTYNTSWNQIPQTFTNLTSIGNKLDTLIASID